MIQVGDTIDGAPVRPPVSPGIALQGAGLARAGTVVVNVFHFAQLTEFLAGQFDRWLSDGSIEVRYVAPLYSTDTFTPHARVTVIDAPGADKSVTAHLEIWCDNQDGVELARGTASCSMPATSGA